MSIITAILASIAVVSILIGLTIIIDEVLSDDKTRNCG
jgi:hypothetical protein